MESDDEEPYASLDRVWLGLQVLLFISPHTTSGSLGYPIFDWLLPGSQGKSDIPELGSLGHTLAIWYRIWPTYVFTQTWSLFN